MDSLHQRDKWVECGECSSCGNPPVEPIFIKLCLHLYCEQCFDELLDEEGNTNTITRICDICQEAITEAVFYKDIHDSDEAPEQPTTQPPTTSSLKRKL